MNKLKYRLFLDKIKNPENYFHLTKNKIYFNDWSIVRNHYEFINCIEVFGIPEIISFNTEFDDTYESIKWLCNHCLENKIKFPFYVIHSQKKNNDIDNYIQNFKL